MVISPQPPSPGTPVHNLDCSIGPGHPVITVSSPVGAGLEYSLNAGVYQANPLFLNVANGNHFLSVRNPQGCVTTGVIFEVNCRCLNQPTVVLSSTSGNTCGRIPITISGNTFGGTATRVTITGDGTGSVTPAFAQNSPFSFTYTPGSSDIGKIVRITVTTDNPAGTPCLQATQTYSLGVVSNPLPPGIGIISQPTCTSEQGSVVLNGLPSGGGWTLTRYPGNVATTGFGTNITISSLPEGTFTFTIANEYGCISAESDKVVINPRPSSPTAPRIGAITQPTCVISTGSVVLSGLPASGNWSLTRLPDGITQTGTGTTYTVPDIPGGTYSYTVKNSAECVSSVSQSFVIRDQPPTPDAPSAGIITPPTCDRATGGVHLMGLPSTGSWILTRYPGTVTTEGTGTSVTVSEIPAGTYVFTISNIDRCISMPSGNVVIPPQPLPPSVPVVAIVTQPTYLVPSGSVELRGLPASGKWILTRRPDKIITEGSGSSFIVNYLPGGIFTFTVTNSVGCTSEPTADIIILTPAKPNVIITDPAEVCFPATANLTSPWITEGSNEGLTFTYWADTDATEEYNTPQSAVAGTYYIKGTTISGFFDIRPVNVRISQMPESYAGPDQLLFNQFSTTMSADLGENESGVWSIDTGEGLFADTTDPASFLSNLSAGNNIFKWIVNNGVCPADTDEVLIRVGDIIVPTLITPNGDTKNEYFVIQGLESIGQSELVIFDRKGAEVFRNPDYDNKWNGVDYNDNPLPNDTYFYVLNTVSRRVYRGYIMIRR